MNFKRIALGLTLSAAALFSASASAAIIQAPVPEGAYITKNGLDWAWANPIPGADLSFQAQFGWRLPTFEELTTLAPQAIDFLIPNGNVPFNGVDPVSGAYFNLTDGIYTGFQSAGACATPYFYYHVNPLRFDRFCDWIQGSGQSLGSPWAGIPSETFETDEQLVVRVSAPTEPPVEGSVPVPAPLALLGLGGLLMAAPLRRRNG